MGIYFNLQWYGGEIVSPLSTQQLVFYKLIHVDIHFDVCNKSNYTFSLSSLGNKNQLIELPT